MLLGRRRSAEQPIYDKGKNIGNESILDLTDRMKTFFNKGGQDNSKLLGNGKTINISIKEDNTALNLIFSIEVQVITILSDIIFIKPERPSM